MEMTILGSGTGYPSPLRQPSGLLIRVGEVPLLFDAGSGTLGRLTQAGLDLGSLEYIHFTHQHSDHCADLVPILQACKLMQRTQPLRVISSLVFFAYMRIMLEAHPWARPSGYVLEEVDITAGRFNGPTWMVDAARTEHMLGSLAFRLRAEGRTIVYTGDATNTPTLTDFARGADVLIAECSFPDEYAEPYHLSPSDVGPMAEEAGVGHLVLTHFYPVCDRHDIQAMVSKWFSGPITLAQDGLTLKI
jgi:ribonuclease BN (tRNA processing enzyme)